MDVVICYLNHRGHVRPLSALEAHDSLLISRKYVCIVPFFYAYNPFVVCATLPQALSVSWAVRGTH